MYTYIFSKLSKCTILQVHKHFGWNIYLFTRKWTRQCHIRLHVHSPSWCAPVSRSGWEPVTHRACAEPQVVSCSMRNDLGGGKGYQLVPVCAGLCQSVPVWEQGSTCSWTGLAPGWSDLGGLRMRRSRWGWVQWHCHDEVESSITFPHPSCWQDKENNNAQLSINMCPVFE